MLHYCIGQAKTSFTQVLLKFVELVVCALRVIHFKNEQRSRDAAAKNELIQVE